MLLRRLFRTTLRMTAVQGALRRVPVLLLLTALGACGPSVVPTEPPAGWMMKPPKAFEDVKAGDDYKTLYADLRKDSGKEKQQIRGLQVYVRTLRGK